jgi:hypothetical protein
VLVDVEDVLLFLLDDLLFEGLSPPPIIDEEASVDFGDDPREEEDFLLLNNDLPFGGLPMLPTLTPPRLLPLGVLRTPRVGLFPLLSFGEVNDSVSMLPILVPRRLLLEARLRDEGLSPLPRLDAEASVDFGDDPREEEDFLLLNNVLPLGGLPMLPTLPPPRLLPLGVLRTPRVGLFPLLSFGEVNDSVSILPILVPRRLLLLEPRLREDLVRLGKDLVALPGLSDGLDDDLLLRLGDVDSAEDDMCSFGCRSSEIISLRVGRLPDLLGLFIDLDFFTFSFRTKIESADDDIFGLWTALMKSSSLMGLKSGLSSSLWSAASKALTSSISSRKASISESDLLNRFST